MSAAPLPTRTRHDYHATLAAPHASEPTLDADLRIYDLRTGPKRTARWNRRDPHSVTSLFVPPIESWTLETVRMTLWELAAFLPGTDDVLGDERAFPQWVAEQDVKASVTLSRSSFRLAVELPHVGVASSFYFHHMTPPMRAAHAFRRPRFRSPPLWRLRLRRKENGRSRLQTYSAFNGCQQP